MNKYVFKFLLNDNVEEVTIYADSKDEAMKIMEDDFSSFKIVVDLRYDAKLLSVDLVEE